MIAVTTCSDFGAPQNKVCHCCHCFPIYLPKVMAPNAMILVFWMLSLSQLFYSPLSLWSRGSLVYLFIFFFLAFCHNGGVICISEVIFISPEILIPTCASFCLTFLMMYSAYKLNKQHENIQPCYAFPDLEPVCCFMSTSYCCFLSCIQISQEAGWVAWYSHILKNFPQFVVIHTVEGLGIINKAEIDVFLELFLLCWWSNRCWQFDLWFLWLL